MTRTLAALLLCVACAGPDPGAVPYRPLDQTAYQRDVHPIAEASCGTLDCHGNQDRPLRIYAETGLRATDALRGQPITNDELVANSLAASAVDDPDVVDDHIILLKALGLMKHSGKQVWSSLDDPQYLCVRAWLAGQSDQFAAECAAAAEIVRLPPP